MPTSAIKGKTLDEPAFAAIGYFHDNTNYNGVDCSPLSVLGNLEMMSLQTQGPNSGTDKSYEHLKRILTDVVMRELKSVDNFQAN